MNETVEVATVITAMFLCGWEHAMGMVFVKRYHNRTDTKTFRDWNEVRGFAARNFPV